MSKLAPLAALLLTTSACGAARFDDDPMGRLDAGPAPDDAMTAAAAPPDSGAAPSVLVDAGAGSLQGDASMGSNSEDAGPSDSGSGGTASSDASAVDTGPGLVDLPDSGAADSAALGFRDAAPPVDAGAMDGGALGACMINGSSDLAFGLVERGRARFGYIEVSNVGAGPCLVDGAEVSPASAAISVTGVPVLIGPGESQLVAVGYAPSAYGQESVVVTLSESASGGSIDTSVSARSAPLPLRVLPGAIDLGFATMGCGSEADVVEVYNTSTAAVTVEDVRSGGAALGASRLALPVVLQPDESLTIDVAASTSQLGSVGGILEIEHSGSTTPFVVPVQRSVIVGQARADVYVQTRRPTDLLLVVDDSCSMSEEQAAMANSVPRLLSSLGADYRVAVTTADLDTPSPTSGRFTGGRGGELVVFDGMSYVDVNSAGGGVPWLAQVIEVGTNGSSTERGLDAMVMALTDPVRNEANMGFRRRSANLGVIVLSDEPDAASLPDRFFGAFLRDVGADVTFNGIVGVGPMPCNGPGGSADPAPDYLAVIDATGARPRRSATSTSARRWA